MTILDGKKTSADLKAKIALEVEERVKSGCKRPHLCAIIVGNDGASQTYVANKEKACKAVGMTSTIIRLPDEALRRKHGR